MPEPAEKRESRSVVTKHEISGRQPFATLVKKQINWLNDSPGAKPARKTKEDDHSSRHPSSGGCQLARSLRCSVGEADIFGDAAEQRFHEHVQLTYGQADTHH